MDRIVQVIPSVLPADKESEICVKSYNGNFIFHDDISYKVQFVPMEEYDLPYTDNLLLGDIEAHRKTFKVKPEDGVLRIRYYFSGEQEWIIRVSCDEYEKYLNPLIAHAEHVKNYPKHGIQLHVYSVHEDLYARRPKRGDLHLHTTVSDGQDTPPVTAAWYRKMGYDMIAITEHHRYNSAKYVDECFDMDTGFKALCAEEVHNRHNGYLHIINLGSRYSINEIYLNEPERVEKEVAELEKTAKVPDGVDKKEYLYRLWTYNEIKKAGGYCIYPHPYWRYADSYHVQTSMSRAVMMNGLCDAFEILGGCSPEENNMQVALYNDLRSEGLDIPVVGSTDRHSIRDDVRFASTVVFAKDDDIIGSIADKYSVAVEELKGENKRVYGTLRLMKYTHFLLREYYPVHNDICFAQGEMMLDYATGGDREALRPVIEAVRKRLDSYTLSFFGN